MANCKIQIDQLNVLTSCPADDEQVLFFNVSGQEKLMALRTWGTLKQCLINTFFGLGILTITGEQLDSENIYLNSDLINDLVVFYNGANRFLILDTEWEYVTNVDNDVVGIKILISATFTAEDVFLIFPNPINL